MINFYGGMSALVEVIQERGVMSRKSIFLYSHIDYGHMDTIVFDAVVSVIRHRADDAEIVPAFLTERILAYIIGRGNNYWLSDAQIVDRLKESGGFGISLSPIAPRMLSHVNVVDIPKRRLGMWTYTGEPDIARIEPKEWLTFREINRRLDDLIR